MAYVAALRLSENAGAQLIFQKRPAVCEVGNVRPDARIACVSCTSMNSRFFTASARYRLSAQRHYEVPARASVSVYCSDSDPTWNGGAVLKPEADPLTSASSPLESYISDYEGQVCTPGTQIILIGPPASGKGAQCELLSKKYGLVHVAVGQLLRDEVQKGTQLGSQVASFLESGLPVPDEIIIPLVRKRLSEADCVRNGWLLDGFPCTPMQAQAIIPDLFIVLDIADEQLVQRATGRRVDPATGIAYHKIFDKPEFEEVQLRLVERPKDRADVFTDNVKSYKRSISAVMEEIKTHKKPIKVINGDQPKEAVLAEIEAFLKEVSPTGDIRAPCPTVPPKAGMFLVKSNGFTCVRDLVDNGTIKFQHPATEKVHLMWSQRPRNVLLLKKKGPSLIPQLNEVAEFLMKEEKMNVFVEPAVEREVPHLTAYTKYQEDKLEDFIDFVVCLGGDGLILHVSQLFKRAVPPILSFALGSLGFLTMFPFHSYREDIRRLIDGDVGISLRLRLHCQLFRKGQPMSGKSFSALNEVVIDRGSSPFLCNLQVYVDGNFCTTVQADGLILATPTGSTAYSLAAGGSMMHPNVPALLFTPLCPHSLSFRPVVFPDSVVIKIEVPQESRSMAWASFDGKQRQKLNRGDSIVVRMYEYPMATITQTDHTSDWFDSLGRCLNWNSRDVQKPFSSEDSATQDSASQDASQSAV